MITQKDMKTVSIDECRTYDRNPRKGDVDAIAESLKINGQFKPIVVRSHPDGNGYQILAGNHTWLAAKKLAWGKVAVVHVPADDNQAKRIVIADNRTPDLGTYDDKALSALLRELHNDGGGLEGTAWSQDDFRELRRLTGELSEEAKKGLNAALPEAPPRPGEDADGLSDPVPAPDDDDNYNPYQFTITIAVNAEQRTQIMDVLNPIKTDHDINNTTDALVKLCELYAADHPTQED